MKQKPFCSLNTVLLIVDSLYWCGAPSGPATAALSPRLFLNSFDSWARYVFSSMTERASPCSNNLLHCDWRQ